MFGIGKELRLELRLGKISVCVYARRLALL